MRPIFEVRDTRCAKCGAPMRLPVDRTYSDPFFVQKIEEENKFMGTWLAHLSKETHELAVEALDHGLDSTYLRKFNDLMAIFKIRGYH